MLRKAKVRRQWKLALLILLCSPLVAIAAVALGYGVVGLLQSYVWMIHQLWTVSLVGRSEDLPVGPVGDIFLRGLCLFILLLIPLLYPIWRAHGWWKNDEDL